CVALHIFKSPTPVKENQRLMWVTQAPTVEDQLGQMTIANEMLHALLPQEKITLSPNGACDVFVVRNSQGERPIAAKTETLKSQVETNLKWLNWFLDRMSTSYMYEFYRNRAAAKLEKCIAAGAP
ncbi:MAG: hypothetical protein WBS22_01610, partial [Methylocystis sp.]